MRLFGQERLMGIFNALGVDEDTEIEHKMLTGAIERAQQKIEINNYGIRRQLLEYDQVMNEQREIMYHERGRVLDNQNMRPSIIKMIGDFVDVAVDTVGVTDGSPKEWNYEELDELILPVIPLEPITFDENVTTREALKKSLTDKAVAKYEEKEALFADPEQMREMERVILLKVIDSKWMNHIDDMDQLKQGVRLQSYAQKDPVVEYKVMGFDMFDDMLIAITEETVKTLFKVRVEANVDREEVAEVHGESKSKGKLVKETASIKPIKREGRKIGRNELCPCGSGKKYKDCCLGKEPTEGKI
jgi:preprotein translocase subunit SecA